MLKTLYPLSNINNHHPIPKSTSSNKKEKHLSKSLKSNKIDTSLQFQKLNKKSKSNKRLNNEQLIPSAYLFIGRMNLTPFVFCNIGIISKNNLNWIINGIINENDYLKEIDFRRLARFENKFWNDSTNEMERKITIVEEEKKNHKDFTFVEVVDLTSV
ncbi:uncharacterized protein I206_105397 [Kwoniella pini CBS 10737]|uniref:Uncharacterized protein n=1 Tax=Kwoniella pini CBS 10737 TaxID=1296096 RepID=A0A1B9I4C9_9TREE|nr:uncharacterized protein I206_03697 [Kwoniella pini CBS 10737]OCF50376.1 hypothetical protein I206_03697 [Kwoniella pini CBS 10737]